VVLYATLSSSLPPSPPSDTIIDTHPSDPQPHSPHPIFIYSDDNSYNSKVFTLNLADFSGMYCIPCAQIATDQYNVLYHRYAARKPLFSIWITVCTLNSLLWQVTSDSLFNINRIREEFHQYFTIAGPVR
jgi:hypothetical protein